ncbi:MAG TPA: prephenate dehydratase [Dehalococcoidia bacterium]|nr:prephenate dehydratase [Dehalococcoidia bacterium]
MTKRLAFLGPPGTFSEQAALLCDPQAQLLSFATVAAVVAAVASGMADEGVMAVENSLEGSVTDTLDVLIHESALLIRREVVLPIEHCLLAKPGTTADQVETIYSHPQALGQCRRFLERCFPKARLEASLSTTVAVEQMMQQEKAAAVATARAAELYGVRVLASGVQDNQNNETRFVLVAPADSAPTGRDKTSFAFSVAQDRPGSLVDALKEFSDREINLTKIESRPTKQELGRYVFLVDLEGHRTDPKVAEALEKVKAQAYFFKVFGSYPRFEAKSAAR